MDEKLISAAQAELAKSDCEVSGMTLAEVLLARRWVTEPTLARFAPWLNQSPAAPVVVTAAEDRDSNSHGDAVYQQNLKRYRQLMHKILEEAE